MWVWPDGSSAKVRSVPEFCILDDDPSSPLWLGSPIFCVLRISTLHRYHKQLLFLCMRLRKGKIVYCMVNNIIFTDHIIIRKSSRHVIFKIQNRNRNKSCNIVRHFCKRNREIVYGTPFKVDGPPRKKSEPLKLRQRRLNWWVISGSTQPWVRHQHQIAGQRFISRVKSLVPIPCSINIYLYFIISQRTEFQY